MKIQLKATDLNYFINTNFGIMDKGLKKSALIQVIKKTKEKLN